MEKKSQQREICLVPIICHPTWTNMKYVAKVERSSIGSIARKTKVTAAYPDREKVVEMHT